MRAMLRTLPSALLLVACSSPSSPAPLTTPRSPVPADAAAAPADAAAPPADAESGVDATTAAPAAAPRSPPTIRGLATLPPQPLPIRKIAGKVTSLAAKDGGDTVEWTISIADPARTLAVYRVVLPQALHLPFLVNDQVRVEADVVGGGPNAVGRITITDAAGSLLLAIHRLPPTWKAVHGKPIDAVDRGDRYDEQRHAVTIRPPSGAAIELLEGWQRFDVAGQRFHGWGSAARRTLKTRAAPPDYVASWIDFAIVAVEDAP